MTTRQEIESIVCACNKVQKDRVQDMSLTELLRYCHPNYRSMFADRLYKDKQLTKEEAKEFTPIL